jgi:hypothetical protein
LIVGIFVPGIDLGGQTPAGPFLSNKKTDLDFLGSSRKRADLASQTAEFFCGVIVVRSVRSGNRVGEHAQIERIITPQYILDIISTDHYPSTIPALSQFISRIR